MDCGSYAEDIINVVEQHCDKLYIRVQRCEDLYSQMITLDNWETVDFDTAIFEINSMIITKWGKTYRLIIQRQERDDAQLDVFEGKYVYRSIITNDYESSPLEIIKFYNKRGEKERIFDEMNNDFGWKRLP